eukprot:scaffold44868_cov59-Attheya_sp.AAC.6
MEELAKNANRTFTYVEQAFFSMWWNDQGDDKKNMVRDLIAKKQLTFVNGGWCMHDEATTHYMGMIDQTALGHSFLKEELNVTPSVGWQLDPFGHSATQASFLTSEVGFNALYFGRIDYQDLNKRHATKECEGIWDSSQNLADTEVFWGLTGSYSGNYGPPPGFCFDIFCDDKQLVGLDDETLKKRIGIFMSALKLQSDRTKGQNIMLTMGEDFQYENATLNFENLDLLIDSVLKFQDSGAIDVPAVFHDRFEKVNIFYSNPELYTAMKHAETKLAKRESDTTKTDSNDSTRAHISKRGEEASGIVKIASGQGFSHHAPHLNDWSVLVPHFYMQRVSLNVSATERPGVDVHIIVYNALSIERSDVVRIPVSINASYTVSKLEGLGSVQERSNVVSSTLIPNINPLDSSAAGYILYFDTQTIPPVGASIYRVQTYLEPEYASPPRSLYHNTKLIERESPTFRTVKQSTSHTIDRDGSIHVVNGVLDIHFSSSGMIQSIAGIHDTGIQTMQFSQEWGYYKSFDSRHCKTKEDTVVNPDKLSERLANFNTTNHAPGVCIPTYQWNHNTHNGSCPLGISQISQNSGAYIFRPSKPDEDITVIPLRGRPKVYSSDLVTEIHSEFAQPWIKQITRVIAGEPFVEFEFTVGPIPIDDGVGKEVITRFNTDIQNDGTFYTDSNGREFMKRRRSQRSSWDMIEYEPVAGNYYPVNAAIYIEDEKSSVSVMVDRSEGGASIRDGSIELMVHRRTIVDDGRGVGEAINETDGGMNHYPPFGDAKRIGKGLVISAVHRLVVGPGKGGADVARKQMDRAFSPPHIFAASAPSNTSISLQKASFSALQKALPENVMLITLTRQGLGNGSLLIRLGHQYGANENKRLSKPVQIDLHQLLAEYHVESFVEKTLSGNQDRLEWDKKKLKWSTRPSSTKKRRQPGRASDNGSVIQLNPMEIRTFELRVRPRESISSTSTKL